MTEPTGVDLTTREESAPAEAEAAPVSEVAGDLTPLMRLALERDQVESLERLVDLVERREKQAAERAMAEAMAAFQADCPPIPKTAVAEVRKNGAIQYTYPYAEFDVIVPTIRACLARHGLSFTHDAEVDQNVAVTCTLRHVMGATRTATFTGPIDKSGGKNPIQQVASARSYGRRYSLIDVLGLATEEDDDGVAAGGGDDPPETITEQQAADLDALIEEVGADRAGFLKWGDVERVGDLPAAKLSKALDLLEQKREAS